MGTFIVLFSTSSSSAWDRSALILSGYLLFVVYLRVVLFGINDKSATGETRRKTNAVACERRKGAKCSPRNRPKPRTKTRSTGAASTRCSETISKDRDTGIIEEHGRPQAQHSEPLERLLYSRRAASGRPVCDHGDRAVQGVPDRRAVGHRGVPPRLVEENLRVTGRGLSRAYSCAACRTCSSSKVFQGACRPHT